MSEELTDINGDPLVEGMLYLQGAAGLRIYLGDNKWQWLIQEGTPFYTSRKIHEVSYEIVRPVCKITDLFYSFERLVMKKAGEKR